MHTRATLGGVVAGMAAGIRATEDATIVVIPPMVRHLMK